MVEQLHPRKKRLEDDEEFSATVATAVFRQAQFSYSDYDIHLIFINLNYSCNYLALSNKTHMLTAFRHPKARQDGSNRESSHSSSNSNITNALAQLISVTVQAVHETTGPLLASCGLADVCPLTLGLLDTGPLVTFVTFSLLVLAQILSAIMVWDPRFSCLAVMLVPSRASLSSLKSKPPSAPPLPPAAH